LELKEEKVSSLNRDLEELTFDGSTEEEIAQLKRSKLDFEKRCKDQEEELDEQAGQIQVSDENSSEDRISLTFSRHSLSAS
jgi:myosin XVIII